MGNAVAARSFGDDYQGMVFWKYINLMLNNNSDISWIGYEYSDLKSFDDIVVVYKNEQRFHEDFISTDYIQVKFHMRQSDFFTLDNLLDPNFINATTNSLMHNIVAAYKKLGDNFKGSRFIIYSLWDIAQGDELYNLISNIDNSFEVDKIFDGKTTRSRMGKIRKKFCDILSIKENELFTILKQTCIYHGRESIAELREILNYEFSYNGLKRLQESKDTNPYIDMIRSWNQSGIHKFDRDYILRQCKKEGLLEHCKDETDIAIRSFKRHTEGIKERTTDMLDLVECFEGRFLKKEYSWNDIFAQLDLFVQKKMKQDIEYHIELETHLTIAFTAGRILNSKSGIKTIPVQKTVNGICDWGIAAKDEQNYDLFKISDELLNKDGQDTVVAISITNDIHDEVVNYLQDKHFLINTAYYFTLSDVGNNSISNGYHAWLLSNQINGVIRKRSTDTKRGILHIFVAGPTALMFNLGKLSMSYGKIQLYEYDFQNISTGTYYQTITFPQEGEN
ncbi:SAVED domain-containing protein [Sedimentibacter sp. B4]|uniref:SAVED domain-containing protein n=1 Tax=Sedimentibacter sp. B4 TaxID=304766 RepID=UPI00030A852E|nr:SAVED domain-containing protein [Sedimentibacter sp. B4]